MTRRRQAGISQVSGDMPAHDNRQRRNRQRVGWTALLIGATAVLAAPLGWITWLGQPPPLPSGVIDAGLFDPPVLPGDEPPERTPTGGLPGIGTADSAAFGPCTRVLAIDGGGVRGLIPAVILAEIETRTGEPIWRSFDVIAGTSTGAVLALGLTRPSDIDVQKAAYTAEDIVTLYREHATEIFPLRNRTLLSLQRLLRPKYRADDAEAFYGRYFSDVRLLEALTHVLVPAYDIEEQRRIWFSDFGYGNRIFMKDLLRAATAAPTFFPPSRFVVPPRISPKGYVALVDGGLFANNPAGEALRYAEKLRPEGAGEILLVSIGTGNNLKKYSFNDVWGWGLVRWVDPLLDIAFSDPATETELRNDERFQKYSPHRYIRLQPDLSVDPIALDDSSRAAIERMVTAAKSLLSSESRLIDELVTTLKLDRSPACPTPLGNPFEPRFGPRESIP
jgi:predicted acylesterase/phospholipase RssA